MEKELKMVNYVAEILDNRFQFMGIKFGINSILDLVPGFGDTAAALLSLYIIITALRLQVPFLLILKMIVNVVFCFVVGLLPFVGDAAYLFYKPNIRNVGILNNYIRSTAVSRVS